MAPVGGIVPVVICDDPWGAPDVLAARLHGRPWLSVIAQQLDDAGVDWVCAVADADVSVSLADGSVVRCPGGSFGELIAASLDHLPVGCELVLVHDPACPFASAQLMSAAISHARSNGQPVATTREVAETVKALVGGNVGATVDRDSVESVHSPVVVPPGLLHDLNDQGALASVRSLRELYQRLRELGPVGRVRGNAASAPLPDAATTRLVEAAVAVVGSS